MLAALGLVLGMLGSAQGDWQTINTEADFSFELPADMVKLNGHGIDSYMAFYRNDHLYVFFDYGPWGAPGRAHDAAIAGHWAEITMKPYQTEIDGTLYTYYVGMAFEEIGRAPDNLTMHAYARTAADVDTALAIFHSLKLD